MPQIKDQMFLGYRNYEEKRNPKTDPESWSRFKKNPFDKKHPPRIYFSLGTINNHNIKLFKSVVKVMNHLKYPTVVGCGENDKTYEELKKFVKTNGWDLIVVKKYADQKNILAKSDVFFCHGA